uniref:Tubulin alpha-6 chain n=1 Tax=Picea sitchensis TaxID=3332 RepID=A9P0A4_PICSI|nr:unknown [Picea sitchensis]
MAVLCSPLICSAMPPKGCKSSPLNALTKSRTTLIPLNTNYNFNQLCFFTVPAKLSVKWNQSILCKRGRGRLSVNCQRTDRDGDPSGEEPPETLFMKELKRRGMTPASLFEENDKSPYGLGSTETKTREEGNEGFTNRNDRRIFTGIDDRNQVDQRARSMALNSEGLEGLIPRARVLLTLGGTFFFVFWPLILATVTFFSAVYIYFGPSFIHGGNKQVAQPTYIDPYKLLEDDILTQSSSPRVPYTSSQ